MSDTSLPSPQIRVEALAAAYHAVLDSLKPLGLPAAEMAEACEQYVTAECLQCGIQITGAQLATLAHAGAADQLTDPVLVRLHQGYCARKDCNSYYYRLVFADHPKIDWTGAANTVARAGAAAPAPTTGAELPSGPSNRFWFLQDRRTRRVIIGLAILVVLLVLRHFTTGGRVPFVRYTPQYVVDPASVHDDTLRAPPPRSTTNR